MLFVVRVVYDEDFLGSCYAYVQEFEFSAELSVLPIDFPSGRVSNTNVSLWCTCSCLQLLS